MRPDRERALRLIQRRQPASLEDVLSIVSEEAGYVARSDFSGLPEVADNNGVYLLGRTYGGLEAQVSRSPASRTAVLLRYTLLAAEAAVRRDRLMLKDCLTSVAAVAVAWLKELERRG